MKIAYVGDFINHGKSLQTTGTPIVILMSLLDNVDSIDVICPELNAETEEFDPPQKVRLRELYKYDDFKSILRLLNLKWKNYDIVIFNILSTGFGSSSIANAAALLVPILLVKFLRQKNIRVIYHNSIFTNDVRMLGYDSAFDRIRSFFLQIVERILFKNLDTFVLLDIYKERIDKFIKKNRVHVLNSRYLEAITTLYINKAMSLEYLNVNKPDIPTVLMHGAWGPQKNIDLGLSELRRLKEKGLKFRLIISGGVNHHFPKYEKKFNNLLHSYADIIDKNLGSVAERDIMNIFLNADLLLLPYNTPGGHSGVLEQAIFFEISTIIIDFPEFKEETNGTSNVLLVHRDSFHSELASYLKRLSYRQKISVRDKIIKASININRLIAPITDKYENKKR